MGVWIVGEIIKSVNFLLLTLLSFYFLISIT